MQNKIVYRITAYYPEEDFCAIFDSRGRFEKLWEFSAFLVDKGFRVMDITTSESFKDINIAPMQNYPSRIVCQACDKGKPIFSSRVIDGRAMKVVKVNTREYAV